MNELELHALYQKSAVFAMPSRAEGFGLVYLEAMSQRLPCIGSLDDAASEIIENGTTGFLVEQSDGPALANRIVRLLADKSLRGEMGAAGYRRSQERFSYRQFSDRIVALIESKLTPSTASWRQRAAL